MLLYFKRESHAPFYATALLLVLAQWEQPAKWTMANTVNLAVTLSYLGNTGAGPSGGWTINRSVAITVIPVNSAPTVTASPASVTISENPQVSQPAPFARGRTVVTPQSDVQVTQEGGNRMFVFRPGVSLAALVRAVNQVGAAPGDVVAILDALKRAGALKAELVVI